MRLLLVEDARALARSIAQGLEEEGFAVDVSGDGEEGLHLASEIAYDAIVLDRMLPTLDGLAILQELRRRGRKAPVLLLTALGQATTLADDERGEAARNLLTEQVAALRSAQSELSAWLDGPTRPDG